MLYSYFIFIFAIVVDLRTIKVANAPLIVDKTPPIPGTVYDGDVPGIEVEYTKHNDHVSLIITNAPLIVDKTPPIPGTVYDGDVPGIEVEYTKHNDHVSLIITKNRIDNGTVKHYLLARTLFWPKFARA